MSDINEKELTDKELENYLGGAKDEVIAEKLGMSVEKYRELLRQAVTDPEVQKMFRNFEPKNTDHRFGR